MSPNRLSKDEEQMAADLMGLPPIPEADLSVISQSQTTDRMLKQHGLSTSEPAPSRRSSDSSVPYSAPEPKPGTSKP